MSVFLAAAGGMIHCMFGSFLANEYMFWLMAILVRYSELYATAESVEQAAKISAAA